MSDSKETSCLVKRKADTEGSSPRKLKSAKTTQAFEKQPTECLSENAPFKVVLTLGSKKGDPGSEPDFDSIADDSKLLENKYAGTMETKGLKFNGLIQAIHVAFADEKELCLCPDDIQIAIARVVARQIASNPEKYADVVKPDKTSKDEKTEKVKKDVIVIEHNGLSMMDSVDNATLKWKTVFPQFETEIVKRCGGAENPLMAALMQRFSTTTDELLVVRLVALMDAVSSYFAYVVRTRCGIPKIHLRGSTEDWKKIYNSLDAYNALDLEWWTKPMKMVINHFISASVNPDTIDKKFWNSIYKFQSRSGGGSASGWALLFSPVSLDPADVLLEDQTQGFCKSVYDLSKCGSGISTVPFTWDYFGDLIPMKFVAGFTTQTETDGVVQPNVGWAVTRTAA